MKKILLWVFIIFVIPIIFSSCNNAEGVPVSELAVVTPPNLPEIGKTTVIGKVVSEKKGQPLIKTVIRLAEVVREEGEAVFVLDGAFSPGAISDENGYFVFENTEPGEYVIIVGDPYEDYDILEDKEGVAKVWNAEEGQIEDVGILIVSLE